MPYTTMRSIAALRRALPEGSTVHVTNHKYRELSGVRTVLKAQTNRWCLSFPESHPRHDDPNGSWLDIPKASEVTFHRHLDDDPGDSVTIYDSDGTPFCTLMPDWPEA